MGKLTLEEIREARPDLVEGRRDNFYEFMLDGTISVFHLFNFPFFFDVPLEICRQRREDNPDVAEKVDRVVEEFNFNLEKYHERSYFSKVEAHKRAFPVYKKVHEKYGVSYEDLLA